MPPGVVFINIACLALADLVHGYQVELAITVDVQTGAILVAQEIVQVKCIRHAGFLRADQLVKLI